ncbi:MAG TPA: glycosyltransferase family 39 protein [Acidobacteriaceae bacterium]|nr:glycosyltransferase family 39 protein [Acidobacteriaceae bacterium]
MTAGVAAGPLNTTERRGGTVEVLAIALAVATLHLLTNGRYGFHRDELQVLSDARHLGWGFVAVPPFTPAIERLGLEIFGVSLVGLRLFSVIAQFFVVLLSGLMARELGGGRLAQAAAALAVALSPLPMFQGTEFQYSSFDLLWWVLIAYCAIRLLKSENGRWWLAIGATTGLALETKYSICFFIAGILGGMALTRARRWFLSGWFWAGTGLALLIFLPNLIWQAQHHFISVTFLRFIHKRDVGEGRAADFWRYQFLYNADLFAAPLWIAGVVAYLRSPRYRMLAWMYLVPLGIFAASRARFYYVSPAYPMLIAMGVVACAAWTARLRPVWRGTIWAVLLTGIVLYGAQTTAALVPLAKSGPLRAFALKNSSDLREEIGWHSLVRIVAAVRDGLTPQERASYGVLVGNYGEEGALETFGPAYGLPEPISLTNSAWYWSYPKNPPQTLIVVGSSAKDLAPVFTTCRLAAHNGNPEGVRNEESQYNPDIFVCTGLKISWPKLWQKYRSFG